MRLVATIRGRVQGVGFRAFVQTQARQLGVTGFVRNESDGSVYVCADGDNGALRDLERRLQRGPLGARVESVSFGWSDVEVPSRTRFEVLP